ncbi:hypothetical protein MPH_12870 [Macrophomina phaseolina MS6]|uniref:Uncharacterized protein n=1 Tax=Macrophomina phaseolina (strain MS6) TaxID=1126212 RepID=K2R732_MACPH|nr:hypothetical protein MPH_12870 [Macrophomina phaseolina MS6]
MSIPGRNICCSRPKATRVICCGFFPSRDLASMPSTPASCSFAIQQPYYGQSPYRISSVHTDLIRADLFTSLIADVRISHFRMFDGDSRGYDGPERAVMKRERYVRASRL